METPDLSGRLDRIEQDLAAGTYRPGPWKAVVEALKARPRAERRALADRVDRVSDLLHRRRQKGVLPLWAGLGVELAGAAAGGGLLAAGLAWQSELLALSAMGVWATAFEPLVKTAAGGAMGIRYSYAFLFHGVEPRFKMRYGTYLAAPRASRVALHLAGCVGSPLAAWLVKRAVGRSMPRAAKVCDAVFWGLNALNGIMFAWGLLGRPKLLSMPVTASSGASAAVELKGMLRDDPPRPA